MFSVCQIRDSPILAFIGFSNGAADRVFRMAAPRATGAYRKGRRLVCQHPAWQVMARATSPRVLLSCAVARMARSRVSSPMRRLIDHLVGAQLSQVTLRTDRSDVHRPCRRARRFMGLYFAALLHGGSNGLLWTRDWMVRGMDGEAKAGESIADRIRAALPDHRSEVPANYAQSR